MKTKRPTKPKKQVCRGRPRIITKAVVEQVGELMAKGMTEEHACAIVGVSPATFGPSVSRSPALKAVLTLCHAKFTNMALSRIALGTDWTGLAWVLERRYGPNYRKADATLQVEHAGEFTLNETQMAELRRIAQKHFTK